MAKQTATWQDWEKKFGGFFVSLPSLPESWKKWIVMVTPYFSLVFGILGVLGGLAGLGFLSAFSFVAGSGETFLGLVATIVASVLMIIAFKGTKARKSNGWTMLFWSEVASLVSSFLSYSFIGGVIGAFIGFYILYQIKPYYK